jgi:hypothetical protein
MAPGRRTRAMLQAVVLAASFAVFCVAARELARALAASINSDALYLDGLYRDVLIEKVPVRGWSVQPAPSFFPDAPLLFAIRAVAGSAVVANAAYGVLELAIYVVLLVGVLVCLGARSMVTVWSAAFLTVAALAHFNSLGDYNHFLFYPSTHSSCVWVGMALALWIARQFKQGRMGVPTALGLVAVTALTAGSDGLYILVAAAPLIASAVLCAIAFKTKRPVALGAAGAIAAGIALAGVVKRWPALLGIEIPPVHAHVHIAWSRVRQMLSSWPPPDHEPRVVLLETKLIVLSIALAAWIVVRSLRGRTPAGSAPRHVATLLAAAFLASMGFTVGGVVFTGMYYEPGCARYVQPVFLLPYLVVGAWLALASGYLLRPLVAAYLVSLVTPWPVVTRAQREALAANVLYPPDAACIDDVSTRYSARYGYGDYWNARRTTELSKTKLHILPVNDSFAATSWIFNRSWYKRMSALSSSFLVLVNRLNGNTLKQKLGEPEHVEQCAGETVWVYPGPPRDKP